MHFDDLYTASSEGSSGSNFGTSGEFFSNIAFQIFQNLRSPVRDTAAFDWQTLGSILRKGFEPGKRSGPRRNVSAITFFFRGFSEVGRPAGFPGPTSGLALHVRSC
jgi:hypothetical protein